MKEGGEAVGPAPVAPACCAVLLLLPPLPSLSASAVSMSNGSSSIPPRSANVGPAG